MTVPGTVREFALCGGRRMGPQECSGLQPDNSDVRTLEMSLFSVRASFICSLPKVSSRYRLMSSDGHFAIWSSFQCQILDERNIDM